MRLIVFGLSVSSAWGNGHATLWRGLIHALAARGHSVCFFERDTPYYAAHRDCHELPSGELVIYDDFAAVRAQAARQLSEADVAIVTSYCADAVEATELILHSRVAQRVFYDLDTPVTLAKLAAGESVPYIGPRLLHDFDLVLSYTGGPALDALARVLGAKRVAALYGSVDPQRHAPAAPLAPFRAELSFLGTYASERQTVLSELFLEPARRSPERTFVIGGSQYPADFPWAANINYVWHVPPPMHPAFYCSARLNLNITRAPMAALGYCPSGRLFESAACGAALISDTWDGLSAFYAPGEELIAVRSCEDVLGALALSDHEVRRIAARARERTLAEHTTTRRADQLLELLQDQRACERKDSLSLEI